MHLCALHGCCPVSRVSRTGLCSFHMPVIPGSVRALILCLWYVKTAYPNKVKLVPRTLCRGFPGTERRKGEALGSTEIEQAPK